jgi:hypothetical protein
MYPFYVRARTQCLQRLTAPFRYKVDTCTYNNQKTKNKSRSSYMFNKFLMSKYISLLVFCVMHLSFNLVHVGKVDQNIANKRIKKRLYVKSHGNIVVNSTVTLVGCRRMYCIVVIRL